MAIGTAVEGRNDGARILRPLVARALRRARAEGAAVECQEVERGGWHFFACRCESATLPVERPVPASGTKARPVPASGAKGRSTITAAQVVRRHLAEAVCDAICRHWQGRVLDDLLRSHYDHLGRDEQREVREDAVSRLKRRDAGRERSAVGRRARILARVQEYLDAHNTLILDGFIMFRMKDYLDELEDALDQAVDDHLLEREYDEFVRLLRRFVDAQEPRLDLVHVVPGRGRGLQLLDEAGEAVQDRILSEFVDRTEAGEVDFDDVLVSALITMAPRHVVLHAASDTFKEALSTIEQVFGTRAERCSGCGRCGRMPSHPAHCDSPCFPLG